MQKYTTIPTHKLDTKSLDALRVTIERALSTLSVDVGDVAIDNSGVIKAIDALRDELTKESNETQSKLEEIRVLASELKTLKTASNAVQESVKAAINSVDSKTLTQSQLDAALVDIEALLELIKDKPVGGGGGGSSIDYTAKLNEIIQDIKNVGNITSDQTSVLDSVRITLENTDSVITTLRDEVGTNLTKLVSQTDNVEPKLDLIASYVDELESLMRDVKVSASQIQNTTSNIEVNSNDITSNVDNVMQLAYKILKVINSTQNPHQMIIDNQTDVSLNTLAAVGNVVVSVVVSATAPNSTVVETGREPYTMSEGEVFSHGNGFSPVNLSGLVLNGSFVIRWEEREQIG